MYGCADSCVFVGLLFSTLSADGQFLIPLYGEEQYRIRDRALLDKLKLGVHG